MIEETAKVISTDNEEVWVETQRRSACGSCAVNNSCGTALLSRLLGVKRNKVHLLNPERIDVAVGDEVIIGIEETALTRGSLAIYIVPLLAMFVFALLGEIVAQRLAVRSEDLMVIGFSIFGLFVGFMWVRRFSRLISVNPNYQPVLMRKVQQSIIQDIPIRFQS